jgi:hypothetical protein
MSGRVVSDIQNRAEGESLYIRYNTDANVVYINNTEHLQNTDPPFWMRILPIDVEDISV